MVDRLQRNDLDMIKAYRRQKQLAEKDPRVIFKPGDQVLLRRRMPGKMRTRAEGPYTFVGYTNTAGWVAMVQGTDGRKLSVSAANLIQLKGRHVTPPPPAEVVWEDSPDNLPPPKRKRP